MQIRMRTCTERRQRFLETPFGQHDQIFRTFAQRRQRQPQYRQAIKQIGAEAAFTHALFEIAMGGADDAHIDGDRPGATDAHHFTLFQYPQQPRLQGQWHFADFIEKQGAAMGRFKQAGVTATTGTGERAFFVAEQFRFQQGFGNRTAIDGDKRFAVGARIFAMNRLRHHFLAGAGFA